MPILKELTVATINVLLLTDDKQADSELNALLQHESLRNSDFHYAIETFNFDSQSFLENLPLSTPSQNYDLGIVWLSNENNLQVLLANNGKPTRQPWLLISRFKLPEQQYEAVARIFVEQLCESDLSSILLDRTIRLVYSENRLIPSEINDDNVKAILDVISEGVIVCDKRGEIVFLNPVAEQMFGTSESKVKLRSFFMLLAGNKIDGVKKYFKDGRNSGKSVLIKEVEGRRANGEIFPLELVACRTQLNHQELVTCTVRDITHIKLRDQEFNLASTIFESHTAMLVTDRNGIILRVNPAFTKITGYSASEAIGSNPKMLQSGHQSREFYEKLWKTIIETGKWEGEIWNRRKNGEIYPEYQTITAVINRKGETTHYVATFQDITERKQTEALIEHQAFYDALTNLPNRRLILDRLNQELAAARRRNYYGALLFMDLDHFKTLNDSMGHAVGDMLLQQMADRLLENVRTEDTVARLGGDEFVVLLANLGSNEYQAGKLASAIATKIHSSLVEPYTLQGNSLKFTSSIGISLFPFDSETADDALKHADSAMYRAKHGGRNKICFYKPSMQAEADRRLKVEKELRCAIENQQLSLYYQPQLSRDGRVVGVEALLRWNHPDEGIILPSEFVALAEEINLIQPIGHWVLKTAIQQFMRWKSSGVFPGNEYIAVNVSPKQLQHADFVMTISQLLIAYDMPPGNLKLEITESVLLSDLREITSKMRQLKEIGVTFSMDDFGTGFSSLTYLKRLPFDQIKIDKSFVRDVEQSLNDAAIVETIIAMAEHLNLDVIAEGVETREEMEFLHLKGCSAYQGFYFSTPLPVAALEQFLKDQSQKDQSQKDSATKLG